MADAETDRTKVLADIDRTQAEIRRSLQYREASDTVESNERAERKARSQYLLDKFFVVITAVIGGIAYVLIEHKIHSHVGLWCMRLACAALTLSLLISFAWASIGPELDAKLERHLLYIRYHGKAIEQIEQSWSIRHYDNLQIARIIILLVCVLGGISLAALGTAFESAYTNSSTQPIATKVNTVTSATPSESKALSDHDLPSQTPLTPPRNDLSQGKRAH